MPVFSFRLLFQCRYIGTSVETLIIEVFDVVAPLLPVAALGPISVHLRLANGECNTKGCNEGKSVQPVCRSFYVTGCHTNLSLLSQWMWPIHHFTRTQTIL